MDYLIIKLPVSCLYYSPFSLYVQSIPFREKANFLINVLVAEGKDTLIPEKYEKDRLAIIQLSNCGGLRFKLWRNFLNNHFLRS